VKGCERKGGREKEVKSVRGCRKPDRDKLRDIEIGRKIEMQFEMN